MKYNLTEEFRTDDNITQIIKDVFVGHKVDKRRMSYANRNIWAWSIDLRPSENRQF